MVKSGFFKSKLIYWTEAMETEFYCDLGQAVLLNILQKTLFLPHNQGNVNNIFPSWMVELLAIRKGTGQGSEESRSPLLCWW